MHSSKSFLQKEAKTLPSRRLNSFPHHAAISLCHIEDFFQLHYVIHNGNDVPLKSNRRGSVCSVWLELLVSNACLG